MAGSETRGWGEVVVVARERTNSPMLTRRALLAGTGQVALLTMLPVACAPTANIPWADGTFWDDGQGWAA